MKTSNKWLLAALLLLLGSLTAYNMGLRAEYAKGTYKDPAQTTTALNFKNFSEVDVQAASQMGVKIVAGPYGVRLNKQAEKYVKVTQQGQRLTVRLAFPEQQESLGGRQGVVIISCPQLRQLTAGAAYQVKGKVLTDKAPGYDRALRVEGFRQDSLWVRQDLGSQVEMANNQLGYLRAETGRSPGSRSVLHIANTNRIQAADLNVQRLAELKLEAGGIKQLRTHFGDSAQATLTGAGLSNLGQHQ
ncbi:hypothetical protein [Hymenobacter ruricola]|uniref:Auto-transporter adhesin head GIN domain-containing protein n=1 Tax=Hymenobacter ruricola TaxID=2791023 RepID=A0ABS0HZ10_9BACT|nr:hypothetical protein [Hymenobacter ruricola]MBF9219942.1 hypothetical protein [Hymenobacter ruricola]